jgi:hypothetical protein
MDEYCRAVNGFSRVKSGEVWASRVNTWAESHTLSKKTTLQLQPVFVELSGLTWDRRYCAASEAALETG